MTQFRNSLEENLEILIDEIKLAVQWQRPSILLTVHRSNLGRDKIRQVLDARLATLGLLVIKLNVDKDHPNPARWILENQKGSEPVYFISNLEWGGGEQGIEAFKALNLYREQFIENRIKAVFWLTLNEASGLARHAPDFWAFRHRVVEFASPRAHSGILLPAGVLLWHGSKDLDETDSLKEMINSREKLLNDLPNQPESLAIRLEILYDLGFFNWKLGDLAHARQHFLRGVEAVQVDELKPYRNRSSTGVANLNYESGEYFNAAEIYKKLTTDGSQDAPIFMNLAFCLVALGKKSEAETSAHKALRIQPNQAQLWNSNGYLLLAAGKLDEAVESFKKAVELSPKSSPYHVSLAVCYQLIGLTDEAIQELNATRALDSPRRDYLDICREAILGKEKTALDMLYAALENQRISAIQIRRDPNLNILFDPSTLNDTIQAAHESIQE